MTHVWMVIAAFNEARVLGPVLESVLGRVPRVVVVDDCSTDDTAALAVRAGAHVLRHPINLGQGAALQTGIDFALRHGAEIIVTFDADGQHDIDDLPVLLKAQRRSGADCVLGSRFLGRTENLTNARRWLLKAAAVFTWLNTGLRLTDSQNGYRLFTRKAAQALHIRHNRMAHASEIVEQIGACGLRWIEAPVIVRYTDYSVAKGQRASDSLQIVLDLLVGRLRP